MKINALARCHVLIGKDASALMDANCKEFIKEIQLKTVCFEKADDLVFSSGYYKK